MRRSLKPLVLLLPLALAVGAFVLGREGSRPHPAAVAPVADESASTAPAQVEQTTVAQQARTPMQEATAIGAAIAPAKHDTALPDEAAIMAQLRRFGADSPLESLALARHGNEFFPNGPDAPERDWTIVKSLVSLRRFHEARDEAELMVRRYPSDPRALDVKRHLLVYPLDQPSREEQQASGP